MHVVAAFFASIVTFVSGLFGSPLLASNSPVDVPSTQTAAAAAPYSEASNPFLVSPTSTSPLTPASPDTIADTAPQPAAGDALSAPSVAAAQSSPQVGVSPLVLATMLATFEQQINQKLAAMPAAVSYAPAFSGGGAATPSYAGTWGLTQRIDSLTNTTITTPTITSPAITGGSLTNVTVNGYLPTSGGTLTGALTGPYFTATSTTATSTFAGGLTAANGGFSVLQDGRIGVGTTTTFSSPTNDVGFLYDWNGAGHLAWFFTKKNGSTITTASGQYPSFYLNNFNGNTGLYLQKTSTGSGDYIAAEDASGNSQFIVKSSGNVGIGTTTPWGKLSITSSGTGTGLAFAVADSANTPRFVIQDNGNVGIGTTTPASKLHVADSSYSYQLLLDNTIASGNSVMGFSVGGATKAAIGIAGAANGLVTGAATSDLIFRSNTGTNSILFSANASTPHMAITSTGNVGVGTTNPGSKLEVQGTVAAQLFNATSTTGTTTIASGQGFTIGSSQFVVQQGSGNVGIGTASPAFKFQVGDYTQSQQKFAVDTANGVAIGRDATTAFTPAAQLDIRNSGWGATQATMRMEGSAGVVGDNNVLIDFYRGNYHVGGIYSVLGSDAINSGELAFSTAALGTFAERMRIDKQGNVGIGTTTPRSKLDVRSAANPGGILTLGTTNNDIAAGSAVGAIEFFNSDNPASVGSGLVGASIYSYGGSNFGTGGDLRFSTASDGASPVAATERMRIDKNGNVGIGTTSPTNKLEVAGNTFLGGNLTATGTVAFTGTTGTTTIASGQGFTIGSSQFVLQQGSGNVGIGTASPSDKLHVNGGIVANGNVNIGDSQIGFFIDPYNTFTYGMGKSAAGSSARLDFYANGGTAKLSINSNGNVGIGTTTPNSQLQIKNATNQETQIGGTAGAYDNSTFFTDLFRVNSAINFSRSTDGAFLNSIFSYETAGLAENNLGLVARQDIKFVVGATADRGMVIKSSGNVGIGTTSPDMLLSVGSATPVGSVAHFENSTGSCYINPTTTSLSCSSDARLKTNVNTVASSTLDALLQLRPVTYNWKTESATSSPHTGFIAQEVQQFFPDLISQGPDGYYTLNYAGLTPYLTKAIQEIAGISGTFKSNLIAWLADASNGIATIVAQAGHFTTEVTAPKICLTDSPDDAVPVCITKAQLAALLSAGGGSQSINFVTSPPHEDDTSPQAPVIELNGNATSTIPLGALYLDLGARIVSPAADTNLGIIILLDGATTTQVSIDTSAPGEHTISYTVTSPTTGLTGSAMRTVTVSPAQQLPVPVVEDNPFTSQPANDNPFNAAPANDNVSTSTLLNTQPAAVNL